VNEQPKLLQPGVTGYAFGSFDSKFPTTLLKILTVAISSNVATITATIREGKVPTVGSLITIRGTTASGGAFNVLNVAIATVLFDSVTGIGVITFTLVNADAGAVADTGMGYVPMPEIGEACANGASVAFAIQDIAGHNDNGLTVQWSTSYPSSPAIMTAILQGADFDADDQYIEIDRSTQLPTDSRASTQTRFRFLRVLWQDLAGGTDPTGVVRINI
jgi:hypothetical protein